MRARDYEKQVALLLAVLPVVANETCFALHGGTAINMFYTPLLRLSVDIDLTYLPVDNRVNSMLGINAALKRIAARVEKTLPGTKVQHRQADAKLLISNREATIKVEVNTVKRGCFSAPEIITLTFEDKQFLVKFEQGVPDWGLYDFISFPAVQWKLLNINQLKAQNPAKYHNNYINFEKKLF